MVTEVAPVPPVKTVEKQPLAEALRMELIKLATHGDTKAEGVLTSEVLLRIMRVAKTGRDLLASLEANPSNLANMVQRPNNGLGNVYFPSAVPSIDGGDEQMSGPMGVSPFAPALPVENFGMSAIREIIAAAKNLNGKKEDSSPVKLVEALVIAREKGLHDVARELEDQLGMKKPVVEAAKTSEGGA